MCSGTLEGVKGDTNMKRLVGLSVLFLFLTSYVSLAGSRYRVVAKPGTAKGADASSQVGEKLESNRTKIKRHKGLGAGHHHAPRAEKQ